MEATIGRIVHYVLDAADTDHSDNAKQCRAAQICATFPGNPENRVNLVITFDGDNDFNHEADRFTKGWKTSVPEATKGSGTWHDPRECPNAEKVNKVPELTGGAK
jgi:hypothetical protein